MKLRILALALLLSTLSGCGRTPPPLMSPDGALTLVTEVVRNRSDPSADLCVVFEIRDGAGKALHRENTRASALSHWTMRWVSAERISLVSSDIGTYYWSRQSDGSWRKE